MNQLFTKDFKITDTYRKQYQSSPEEIEHYSIDFEFKNGEEYYNSEITDIEKHREFVEKHKEEWIKAKDAPQWLLKSMAAAVFDGIEKDSLLLSPDKNAYFVSKNTTHLELKNVKDEDDVIVLPAESIKDWDIYSRGGNNL